MLMQTAEHFCYVDERRQECAKRAEQGARPVCQDFVLRRYHKLKTY